jgi:hypothetical protein
MASSALAACAAPVKRPSVVTASAVALLGQTPPKQNLLSFSAAMDTTRAPKAGRLLLRARATSVSGDSRGAAPMKALVISMLRRTASASWLSTR